MEMEDHQTPWKGRRSTSTTWEGGALGGEEEGVRASLLCDFTILSCSTDPGLHSKARNRGAARRQLLLCNEGSTLCGPWYLALKEGAKEKSLNLAGRGEAATPEGLMFLTHFVLSFHFLSIWLRESESCFL